MLPYSIVSPQGPSSLKHVSLILIIISSCALISLASRPPLANYTTTLPESNQATDQLALLSLKALISHDPTRALASWNDVSLHFCQWLGVTCDDRQGQPRVTALNLGYLKLAGYISPFLGNLTFLQRLSLHYNRLRGPIPRELGFLFHLKILWLSYNSLQGEIPATLSHCINLQCISLKKNYLHGKIPPELSHCSDLQNLTLGENMLTGEIPSELGSLARLTNLLLDNNQLTGGIPHSLGNLSYLTFLDLSFNNLSGVIPSSLWNLSSLTHFHVQTNKLSGMLPQDMGLSLPHLQQLRMYDNLLSGTIPASLGASHGLTVLQLSDNQFEAGDWAFLTALANCSSLQLLHLANNKVGGMIPTSIANLSTQLEWFVIVGNQISGSIPPEIGNLVNLQLLYLNNNLLTGTMPPSLGNISELTRLNLAGNLLTGTIPATIGELQRLEFLTLAYNRISGAIPPSLGNLSKLTSLHLGENYLIRGIPPSIGNISSLRSLSLLFSKLRGSIPHSLKNLRNLNRLDLAENNLTGTIPSSLWNHSVLIRLVVGGNKLTGALPSDLGSSLPHLKQLGLYDNQFYGPIPISLSNASMLEWIELGGNAFTGIIPQSLGTLSNLSEITFASNQLEARGADEWSFLDAVTNCTKLQILDLGSNKLSGMFPASIANLSTGMDHLLLNENQISGSIPIGIGNLKNITLLDLSKNFLRGSIPASIGGLQSLQILNLEGNNFSGEIPSTFGYLKILGRLFLQMNELTGSIPTSLGNCSFEMLDLSHNKLSGTIPKEILLVSSLSWALNLSYNLLNGQLPYEVGSLKNLRIMDVSKNRLSGLIPSTLGKCQILEVLHMEENLFSGTIPLSLQELKGLQELDLSLNNLSGHIPEFLITFPFLTSLNLSFNNLEGRVPKDGVFKIMHASSVLGNIQLCGGQTYLKLPSCASQTSRRKNLALILSITNIVLGCMLLCIFAAYFWNRKSIKYEPTTCEKDQQIEVSFPLRNHMMEVPYDVLFNATNGFSASNLIGMGGFGSVYKGIIDYNGQKFVAVKVLNLQQNGAIKSFQAECKALRNTRHRNLVKMFTSCSSKDFNGNEFKALVFEYMPNGSLDKWLHPKGNDQNYQLRLSLIQRINIAIDVAFALDYLHHHGPTPIIHCDLKPSNVLLDYDISAHVGDFGLARFMSQTSSKSTQTPTNSAEFRGSIGYVAPEYGIANKASIQGDVYSYGVLLLEMFTGKRPTDHKFRDSLSLCEFVKLAFPNRLMEIVDPRLFLEEEGEEVKGNNGSIGDARTQECLTSVFRLGISCAKEIPHERMQMEGVIKELMAIKITFLGSMN